MGDRISTFDANSEADFGAFYNKYYLRFVRYAFYYINSRHTAEDIAHDAILYYWENRKRLPENTDVLGYIILTIRNRCLNYLKHLKVENEHAKQCSELHEWEIKMRISTLDEAHYAEIFTTDMQKIIAASLARLPEQTQYIFIQNRFKYKSRKEIAVEMNVSQQKVDYHINKATEHLCRELKDYLPVLVYLICEALN